MSATLFYVGTDAEVAHHARPLRNEFANLQIAEPADVSRQAKPGDLVIFFSEHFDRFRDLCVEMKQARIPTIYAIDGILEWRNAWENRLDELACPWTMRPCLSDVVASIGARQTSLLNSWGNMGRVYNVGIPRLDSLVEKFMATPPVQPFQPLSTDQHSLRILVVTAKCPGFTPEQLQITYESLKTIKDFYESTRDLGGKRIRIQWRLTGDLGPQLGAVNSNDQPLARQIEDSDIVISTASTVLLESMLLGKPTVLLDFHNTPAYVPCAWNVSHASQLKPTLLQIMSSHQGDPKMQLQRFLLSESLHVEDSSIQRMTELIKAVFERAAECRTKQTWSFDNLPVSSATSCRSSHSDQQTAIGGNLPVDFAGMNWEQLSAYAGQLKRENRRLSRLVDEAHVVFDQMQGHPVLGTILKTHKWFSEQILKRPATLKKPSDMENPS